MMNNMFAMFDPSSNFLSMNWLSLLIPLLLFKMSLYKTKDRLNKIQILFHYLISQDLKTNLTPKLTKNMIILMTIFWLIYILNLTSLYPFIFASTSHMVITMILSFPFWATLMLKGWFLETSNMLTHTTPLGTPMLLAPFMVIIETISSMIRPITLSVRLAANMVAGHILIALLSSMMKINIFIFMLMSPLLTILIILEMSVSLIQSYVMVILLSLYMNEIN